CGVLAAATARPARAADFIWRRARGGVPRPCRQMDFATLLVSYAAFHLAAGPKGCPSSLPPDEIGRYSRPAPPRRHIGTRPARRLHRLKVQTTVMQTGPGALRKG